MDTLTIKKGLTYRGDYVMLYDDDGALDLSQYAFQPQILDSNYKYLGQTTATADGTIDGKLWLSMTATETANIDSSAARFVLLVKSLAGGWFVASKVAKINLEEVATWN